MMPGSRRWTRAPRDTRSNAPSGRMFRALCILLSELGKTQYSRCASGFKDEVRSTQSTPDCEPRNAGDLGTERLPADQDIGVNEDPCGHIGLHVANAAARHEQGLLQSTGL